MYNFADSLNIQFIIKCYLIFYGGEKLSKKRIFGLAFSSLLFSYTYAADNKLSDVAPYPKAAANDNRNVIWLEKRADEENLKVEIIATKKGIKDCNNTWYSGDLKEIDLQGWGYTYYKIEKITGPMSTRMGCLNGEKQTTDLAVNLGNKNSLTRYNSKLPIVVYAPKDVLVNLKIWKADETLNSAISND